MKLTKVLSAAALAAVIAFSVPACKSGPKDADIKTAIEEKFKGSADMAGTTVDVKDGVATLTGVCKDEECKTACGAAAKEVKGVKDVVNNCTVAPPPPPPASTNVTTTDPKLQDAVKAIIKDIPGIKLDGFSEKGAILSGTLSADNNKKLRQAMAAAKIMIDVASKLTVK
jgi:hyperosmotically inducible periplasmic protein